MLLTRRSLLALPALAAADDGEEILARAVSFDVENYLALKPFVWNSEETGFRDGRESRHQKYEINMLSGAMYWRKLESQHKPLTGAEADLESKRLAQHLKEPRPADGLPPDSGWRFERAFYADLPRLHRIEKYTQEDWRGLPVHHLRLKPVKDARTQHPHSAFASSFEIDVLLEKQSLHWVHSEWRATQKVAWTFRQLTLGRLSMIYSNNIVYRATLNKKDYFSWTMQRLPGMDGKPGPWTLAEYETKAGNYRNHLRYFNFRRYASESELIVQP
jgi:hypothetical protein